MLCFLGAALRTGAINEGRGNRFAEGQGREIATLELEKKSINRDFVQ